MAAFELFLETDLAMKSSGRGCGCFTGQFDPAADEKKDELKKQGDFNLLVFNRSWWGSGLVTVPKTLMLSRLKPNC